ncbi:hypothetical protein [Cryobacterium sp. AP23]
MINRAQSAGLAPARLRVTVPQPHKPGVTATRSTHTLQSPQQASPPRAVVAIGLASVIIAGCVYTGTELVLELLHRAPLIAAPTDVVRYVSQVNEVAPPVLLALGVVVALACVPLVLVAGRRARREAAAAGAQPADDVAAGAVGPASSSPAPLTPASVPPAAAAAGASTTGSRHRATVPARPVAGIAPDRFTAEKAIADALAYESLRPSHLTDPQNHPLEKERTP